MLPTPEMIKTNERYKDTLLELSAQAKKRILLDTMSFEGYGDMTEVVQGVVDAADRGVETHLIADRYSFFDTWMKRGWSGVRQLEQTLRTMSDAGIDISMVGHVRPNPFSGRHHTKTYIFDDSVLTAGGANLTDDTFGHIDFMMKYSSPHLADVLSDLLPIMAKDDRDAEMVIDQENAIFYDGGRKGQSAILNCVIDSLTGARRVWYVSKMVPHPLLANALDEVSESSVWFNRPDKGGKLNRLSVGRDIARTGLKSLYGGSHTLHAKFCVVEYEDDQKKAITGSHNFNQRGVNWGTQEMAFITDDQSVCAMLIDFADSLPKRN